MSRPELQELLRRQYTFHVIADEDGGYVILYPDLPGCMTQVESVEEVAEAAEEVRELWLEAEYEMGAEIPEPSYPETHSGKFNVRLPRSLHRRLAESAAAEAVSLNQYVTALLERNDALARVERRLDQMQATGSKRRTA